MNKYKLTMGNTTLYFYSTNDAEANIVGKQVKATKVERYICATRKHRMWTYNYKDVTSAI